MVSHFVGRLFPLTSWRQFEMFLAPDDDAHDVSQMQSNVLPGLCNLVLQKNVHDALR